MANTDNTNNTNNTDLNIVKISGSIGMTKLVKDEKNIYIFYDDHSNISYCKNTDSIFLYDVFDEIVKNTSYIILLEEPFINNYSNVKFLWNETPHIIKFRNFYKKVIKKCSDTKICNVFPIDIRLIICDVSIDELVLNINSDDYFNNYKISVFEYFKYLLYLFDYIEWDEKLFSNSDPNIKFLKKVFSKYIDDIYYIKLKYQFNKLYEKFIILNKHIEIKLFIRKYNDDISDFFTGYPFENNNENIFLDQYDKLINGIMEFYTYILISGMNYKNIIIYCGYYHSNNLAYILKKFYNFTDIYRIGNTENIEKKNDIEISNCLYIDKKIFQ
jgi:hypothetical protein